MHDVITSACVISCIQSSQEQPPIVLMGNYGSVVEILPDKAE